MLLPAGFGSAEDTAIAAGEDVIPRTACGAALRERAHPFRGDISPRVALATREMAPAASGDVVARQARPQAGFVSKVAKGAARSRVHQGAADAAGAISIVARARRGEISPLNG